MSAHTSEPIVLASNEVNGYLYDRTPPTKDVRYVAVRDLKRYYLILEKELPGFSLPEARLLYAACGSGQSWTVLDELVRDAGKAGYGIEAECDDPEALADRLLAMSEIERLAICDAIERAGVRYRYGTPLDTALEEVGLFVKLQGEDATEVGA